MIPIDTDVAVIGGGPAGIAAALSAARRDLAVTLVEPGRIGGPPTMLAWRVLERTVDRHLGRSVADVPARDAVWAEARAELSRLAAARQERLELRLADAGVDVVRGRARFASAGQLDVDGGPDVRFERAVVATGSSPDQLTGDPPDGRRLVTPDTLFERAELPAQVMVVGGGAAAAELVDSLSRVGGIEVHWVMDELGILPRFERELAEALGDVLLGRGVLLVHDKPVRGLTVSERRAQVVLDGGKTYDAPLVVLCAGRRPSLEGLGLDAIGLANLDVDEHLRTPVEHIFAAGECTGRCPSASHAEAMGRLAGLAVSGAATAAWDASRIPLVVHSHPQLAQIGATPERLVGRDILLHTARAEESRAGLLFGVGESLDDKGFLRLACDSATGLVLGLSAAGPGAASAASAVAIALRLGATDETLADVHVDVLGPLDGLLGATR